MFKYHHESAFTLAKFVPIFASDDKLLISTGNKDFLSIDFSKTSRDVADFDAERLYDEHVETQAEIAEKKRARELAEQQFAEQMAEQQFAEQQFAEQMAERKAKKFEERKKKMRSLREKFSDEEKVYKGRIVNWKGSFGFILGEKETKELETIFVHITAFVDRADHLVK